MERITAQGKANGHGIADDPLTAEPYRWDDCTVSISITLLPETTGEAHERVALVGVRTHADAPLIRRLPAYEVLPLPPALTQLLDELREQLPARAAQYEERQTRASATVTPATNAASVSGKRGKTGRSLAAATSPATVEPMDWSDDMFSAPPVTPEPDAAAPASAPPSPSQAESEDSGGWQGGDIFAAPPEQLSLL
jgi:hypothetical protein